MSIYMFKFRYVCPDQKINVEMSIQFEIAGFQNNQESIKFVKVNHLLIKYSTL